jgi:hypothetical protein
MTDHSFNEKLRIWNQKEEALKKSSPLKTLKSLPNMPGITKETAKGLKWKSLVYLLKHDKNKIFKRFFLKRPFTYGFRLLFSYLKGKSFERLEDFFFYGLKNEEEFRKKLENPEALFVLGFSYCHKPFECPSGRFSDQCQRDPNHNACGQCFIGKCCNLLPKKAFIPVFIPTVHYIGEKLFEITHQNPGKEIVFLITACELTLKMFGDWGVILEAQGIGVRLDGRVCNTMEAFNLSEGGIKPGLTVVLDQTKEKILELLALRSRLFPA